MFTRGRASEPFDKLVTARPPPRWAASGYSPNVWLAGFFGRKDAGIIVNITNTTAITNTAV